MEGPTEYTVKLKRDGMLDDSVRADINIFVLLLSDKGYWVVGKAKRASSCWKDKRNEFYGKSC